MRLTSNVHEIPFELAYNPSIEKFLGSLYKIGRVQLSAFPIKGLQRLDGLSMLVIGDIKPNPIEGISIPELPFSKAEVEAISDILTRKGFRVRVLNGAEATFMNLQRIFNSEEFQIIHFSAHGISQAGVLSGLVLADRIVKYDELLPANLPPSLIVLSACSSGVVLNEVAIQFIEHGAIGLIGFIGPVTDNAAEFLAVKFYEALAKGETLGNALQIARETFRAQLSDDFSWASFVLFGDPTITVV